MSYCRARSMLQHLPPGAAGKRHGTAVQLRTEAQLQAAAPAAVPTVTPVPASSTAPTAAAASTVTPAAAAAATQVDLTALITEYNNLDKDTPIFEMLNKSIEIYNAMRDMRDILPVLKLQQINELATEENILEIADQLIEGFKAIYNHYNTSSPSAGGARKRPSKLSRKRSQNISKKQHRHRKTNRNINRKHKKQTRNRKH